MPKMRISALIAFGLLVMCSGQVQAELTAVSGKPLSGAPNVLTEIPVGGNPSAVAVSLAHGFPIWYKDANNIKLELCLDKPNAGITPCLTAEPFTGAPISFPNNFGPEAFYWMASTFATYNSRLNGTVIPIAGDALLVLALEGAFASGIIDDTQQVAFGRIRVRLNVPVPGTYRVTHPYGRTDYVVTAVDAGREINQTQDVGIVTPHNFVTALEQGPDPDQIPLPIGFPATNAGIVSEDATNVGPFLRPSTTPYNGLTHVGGPLRIGTNLYLGDSGSDAIHIVQPIVAGPPDSTPRPPVFTVELLNPPANFFLNGDTNTQILSFDQFQVMGKVFNDSANLVPTAVNDTAATARNTPVSIDVLANDNDPVGMDPADPFNPANPANTNVHGINPQAIGIYVAPNDIRRTAPFTTAQGGIVSRFTTLGTGKTTFIYTPPPGYTGDDSFQYVVQDTGGLISAPATVTVTVENLGITKAEYRPRIGKWHIAGTSSDTTANTVTVLGGPRAFLAGSTGARGSLGLKTSPTGIDYRLVLDPLPASAVSRIDIRLHGADGPAIFTLYDSRFNGAFSSPRSGRLTTANLQSQPADGVISLGDAIARVLSGSAYISVRTTSVPTGSGELSGRISRPVIGTAPVGTDGRWALPVKSKASPGPLGTVSVTSSNGISSGTVDLTLR